MTKQEALAIIAEKLVQAQALVTECESIAESNDVEFRVNFGGYGMGGTFGKSEEWESSEWEDSSCSAETTWEWHASSQSC